MNGNSPVPNSDASVPNSDDGVNCGDLLQGPPAARDQGHRIAAELFVILSSRSFWLRFAHTCRRLLRPSQSCPPNRDRLRGFGSGAVREKLCFVAGAGLDAPRLSLVPKLHFGTSNEHDIQKRGGLHCECFGNPVLHRAKLSFVPRLNRRFHPAAMNTLRSIIRHSALVILSGASLHA